MVERKVRLRARVAMGASALLFAALACGGAPAYPCDQAFFALQDAFSKSLSGGNMPQNLVEIGPSLLVIATHPDVLINGKTEKWATVVKDMDINCKDGYSVNYVGAGSERFTEGVTVRRKSTQNFSLPESSPNWVNNMLLAAAAVLGISALLGTKKLIAA